ncbi:MAG: S41 family peptidase, partial [Bryobacteraceae bacterium]
MRWVAGLCLFALTLEAQLTPQQKRLNVESFEKVWTTIRDRHWEKNPGGLNWNAIHTEYLPKVEQAQTMEQARAAMREMLGRLKETHFAIFSGSVYGDVDPDAIGAGSPGIETRVIDGQAVVTRLDPGSPAEQAGVKPGWIMDSVNGKPIAPVIQNLKSTAMLHDITVERAVSAKLSGDIGATIHVDFLDAADRSVPLALMLVEPRGKISQFGNLPPMPVWS